jgi:hypothetical protein
MDWITSSRFKPWLYQTLLGIARPVSDYWADLYEPWQPDLEKYKAEPNLSPVPPFAGSEVLPVFPTRSGNGVIAFGQPVARDKDDNSGFAPAAETRRLADGNEILSDAAPGPVVVGQQYAQAARPPRRGGGPPEGPVGRLLSDVYQAKLRTLRELEPSNRFLSTIQPPDWRPAQSDINRLDLEIAKARQRAPGAIDSQASGIGIGPFAREAIPARSGSRAWTPDERAEINRMGYIYGCHTCGTREPGTVGGNFFGDHQSPTRLNPPGQNQIVVPHCMSCSVRQGGLISSIVRREKP